MKKLEELIYSVKYLPQILYFGSVGLLGYDIYSYLVYDIDFLNPYLRFPIVIIFFLMTGFGVERYNKNKNKIWKLETHLVLIKVFGKMM